MSIRPAVIAAFDAFIDQLLANPVTAPLAHDGNWSVHSNSLGSYIRVIQHVRSDDPSAVLDTVAATFGGTFAAGSAATSGCIWHELETEWRGARLELKLAAPGLSAEETLRARVAELEQQLAERPDPLESALLSAWNNSEPDMPECHLCGNPAGPWAPEPSGARWPSGAQKLVCKGDCTAADGAA